MRDQNYHFDRTDKDISSIKNLVTANIKKSKLILYKDKIDNFLRNDKNNKGSYSLPIGMCIGIAIGTAIGAATHNNGLWMPIGLSVGLCLGLVLGHNREYDNEDDTDDKQ